MKFSNIISAALGFLCVLVLKMNEGKGKINCAALQKKKGECCEDGFDVQCTGIRQHLQRSNPNPASALRVV